MNLTDNKTSYSLKEIIRIAFPVMFSLLMQNVLGLIDTAFIGRLGQTQLAAIVLASVFYLILYMIGFGFSIGAQILTGMANGQKNYPLIGRIFHCSIFMQIAIAVILFLLYHIFHNIITPKMIQSPDIADAFSSYLKWRVPGLFFILPFLTFRAFFMGIKQTKILIPGSLIMVFTNFILDYLLIFGKAGFPKMGMSGAAIASTASEFACLLFFIVYSRFSNKYHKYFKDNFAFDLSLYKKIFSTSIWMMIQSTLALTAWFFFFVSVEHLGESTLASLNLIRTTALIPFILTNAFAVVTCSLVSNSLGENRFEDIMKIPFKSILAALCFVLPLLGVYMLFPDTILGIYVNDANLIAETKKIMPVMSLVCLIQVPASIWFNVVSGTGKTKIALIIEFTTLCIYSAAVVWIVIIKRSSPSMCWSAELYYQTVMLVISFIYVKSFCKNRSKIRQETRNIDLQMNL